jgi:hypothetical protein
MAAAAEDDALRACFVWGASSDSFSACSEPKYASENDAYLRFDAGGVAEELAVRETCITRDMIERPWMRAL